ncbi:hypothetical protein L1049_014085 [Liquidambar formosana]|uniref:DUF4220 domain-containing protein n=1 Tax=Liquidambar formosana TaxID=63359 RepID=A0AAP0RR98_LIQFO
MSWMGSTDLLFTFLAIPVFIAGIIKYGERTWVLRSASTKQFRDSLLPDPDPGPDYAKLMEEISQSGSFMSVPSAPICYFPRTGSNAFCLDEANILFGKLKKLYAGLILSFHEITVTSSIMSTSTEAFKRIEVELGFLYDVLYTKATIIYSRVGIFLRSVTLLSSISTLVAFSLVIDKNAYSNIDVTITYLLLVGTILVEIYAVFVILFSDWAMLWLIKHKKPWTNSIYEAVSSSRRVLTNDDNRWSGSMAQFNLISFCLKDKPTKRDSVLKLFGIYEMLEKHQHKTFEDVNIELKDLIFQRIRENHGRLRRENVKEISTQRGDSVLVEKNCIDKFGWSIGKVEFDESLLLWHIATDLCYYSDLDEYPDANLGSKFKLGKLLSDYMSYLLIMCPFMLPKGIGQIRFRDTCAEAERFFQQRRLFKLSSRSNACMLLLQVNIQPSIQMVKGDRSKSVLFYGCKLAHLLQSLITEEGWDNEEKWEMISYVWVEMLSYAASQCEWNHHAEQLRRGGELLTHVRLLKEHLGLSKQYQIFSGTSRATVH